MDAVHFAKVLERKLQLDLVPEHHGRQVVSGLAFVHEFVAHASLSALLLRKLLGVHYHCHFFVAPVAHLTAVDQLVCLLLDPLAVHLQLSQCLIAAVLKVVLRLTVNFKAM